MKAIRRKLLKILYMEEKLIDLIENKSDYFGFCKSHPSRDFVVFLIVSSFSKFNRCFRLKYILRNLFLEIFIDQNEIISNI